MKRDMDLIRRMLLAMEAMPPMDFPVEYLDMEDVPRGVLREHAVLLIQNGFIEGEVDRFYVGATASDVKVTRITWEGHEYIDKIRNDTVWASVKSTAKEKGVDLTIDIVKALATAKIRTVLGLPPT